MEPPSAHTLARALTDAGVDVVTAVPGYGATLSYAAYQKLQEGPPPWSYHEEVAFAVAWGAAFVGHRSAVMMKSHGVLKAANAVPHALLSGVAAGFVALVFDDPEGAQSDGVLDIRPVLRALEIPTLEPASEDVAAAVVEALRRSETTRLPVAVLMRADGLEKPGRPAAVHLPSSPPWVRDPARHLVMPAFSGYQRRVLDHRLAGDDPDGIPRPRVPMVPDDLDDATQSRFEALLPLLEVFCRIRGTFVAGDVGLAGLSGLPPLGAVDVCTYMGGSIPMAVGAHLTGLTDTWAVTGDFAFLSAGHLGLLEAVQRGLPLKVLVLWNGEAAVTGGQEVPEPLLFSVVQSFEPWVRYIDDPLDEDLVEEVLGEAANSDEMRVVLADVRR